MDNLENEFTVIFRIMGEDLYPEVLTERLGIVPDAAHKKGDPNAALGKGGKPLEYAPFSFGLWSIESKLARSASLEEHLVFLLNRLEPATATIKGLSLEGYSLDFFCGLFLNQPQSAISLAANTLARISALGAHLDLDLYSLEKF